MRTIVFILIYLLSGFSSSPATASAPGSAPAISSRETNPAVLLKLANFYLQKKDTRTAIQYYHRLIPGMTTSGDNQNLALIYYKLARIAKSKHKYTEALILAHKSVTFYEKVHDPKTMIDVLNFMGIIYGDLGFPEKSFQYQLRALNIAERIKDYQRMSIMLVNISNIRGPDHAAEFLNRALDAVKNVKNDTTIGYVYNITGLYYLGLNKFDSALYFFNKSLVHRTQVKDYQGISFSLNNVGEVYYRQGRNGDALRNFNKGLDIAISANDALSMCISYGSLAKYYQRTGNDQKSFEMMKKNLELSRLLQFKWEELDGLKNIATYYEKKNQPREALKYFKRYDSLKDTLFEEKRQLALTELQARYEMAIKEKEILKLQSENEKKSARIQRNRVIIFSMIAGFAIIITASWFMTRFYRDKIKVLKELVRRDVESIKAEHLAEPITTPRIIPVSRNNTSFPTPAAATRSMVQINIPDELKERLYGQLITLMKVEKRYLDPSLTLADISKELNTNTSYLSRVINDKAAQNFSQFLNEFRIKETRRLLSDPDFSNLSIEGIAQTVGFNSKSAFNAAFKSKTGVTPSFYQQSAKRINSPELPAEKIQPGLEAKNYPG